ncbi:hypothetical protein D3C78_908780 [compost metagenome]
MFAWHGPLWHRPLLDVSQRSPRAPVKHEQLTALGRYQQGEYWRYALCARQVDRGRLRWNIVVPNVVVGGLEVPAYFSAIRVDGDQRTGIFFRHGLPAAAEEIRRFVTGWQIDQAQRRIIADRCPDIWRAARVELACGWKCCAIGAAHVEGPCQLAGAGIKCAHDAGGLAAFHVIEHPPADHSLAVHDRGR